MQLGSKDWCLGGSEDAPGADGPTTVPTKKPMPPVVQPHTNRRNNEGSAQIERHTGIRDRAPGGMFCAQRAAPCESAITHDITTRTLGSPCQSQQKHRLRSARIAGLPLTPRCETYIGGVEGVPAVVAHRKRHRVRSAVPATQHTNPAMSTHTIHLASR